jgi:serine/threonine protein kinase
LLGQLTGAEAERWEEHLSGCSRCADTLGGMEQEAAITGFLRVGSTGSDPGDGAVEELIGRLKKLLPLSFPGEAIAGESRPCTPFPAVPGQLAQYRLLEKLGEGGMGAVFRAEDTRLGRLVALKVMHPRLVADEAHRLRFLQEARAAAAVEHPRVVTIYDVNEDGGVPFLAMQLLQGQTLETRLRQQPPPYPAAEIVRLAKEIAEGLEGAHARGLVHRDIKPSNVWLEGEPGALATGARVKLLDFGLARVTRTSTRLTQSGVIVGTPGFLAPEQAAGQLVDERSDLFSLGVVLYLLATGRLPFEGRDLMALLTALAVEQPRSVFEHNPALPEALGHLIMRLLSKEPRARPPSARAVIDVLAEIEMTLADRSARAATEPPTEVLARPSGHKAARLWRWALAGAAVMVLALVLVAVLGGRGGEGRKDAEPAPATETERFADEPAADTGVPPKGWTILFRSDDPSIWNKASPDRNNFAAPVRRAHRAIRYLRLKRMDTGDYLVLPIRRDQLDRAPQPMPDTGHAWNGTALLSYNARNLGIAQAPRHRWPNHRGVLSVTSQGWDAFSGSGFCGKCQFNDGQHYCWQTKEIPKTVFEIAVSAGPLSAEEQPHLLK